MIKASISTLYFEMYFKCCKTICAKLHIELGKQSNGYSHPSRTFKEVCLPNFAWVAQYLTRYLTMLPNFFLPVLVPPVIIQAPVVLAAFRRPFLNTRFSFGCRSKFRIPPCTVINSFGRSRLQWFCRSCRTWSAFES